MSRDIENLLRIQNTLLKNQSLFKNSFFNSSTLFSSLPKNSLLTKFESVTSNASAISSDVIEDKHLVEENLKRIEKFYGNALEELKNEIRKSHKSPMAIIALWINIVSILLTLYAILDPHLK